MRLFIGIQISMAAVDAITEAVVGMRGGADASGLNVRWVPPASYHVTLKFLGEARPETVAAIRDAVAAAVDDEAAFRFATRGAGAFPSPERARVLWIGADDAGGRMARIAAACDEALAPLGFEPERRAFHPHVTIGRLRQVANAEALVLRCTEQEFSETRASAVTLFESTIKSNGSEYAVRAQWPLRQTGSVERTPGPNR